MASENIYMYICILTVFLQLTYEMNEELQDNLRAKMQNTGLAYVKKLWAQRGTQALEKSLQHLSSLVPMCTIRHNPTM